MYTNVHRCIPMYTGTLHTAYLYDLLHISTRHIAVLTLAFRRSLCLLTWVEPSEFTWQRRNCWDLLSWKIWLRKSWERLKDPESEIWQGGKVFPCDKAAQLPEQSPQLWWHPCGHRGLMPHKGVTEARCLRRSQSQMVRIYVRICQNGWAILTYPHSWHPDSFSRQLPLLLCRAMPSLATWQLELA